MLDVRYPDDISGPLGHISRSRMIPVAELDAHWAELEPERDCPVAVLCNTDKRSRLAVQWLTKRGFAQVYRIVGDLAGDAVARPVWMTRDGQHEKERHAYHGY